MAINNLIYLAQKVPTDGIPTLTGEQLLVNALNIFYFIAGLTAVIVIIVGAMTYTTSRGDAGSLSKAKNMILYAVIGLIVVMSAFAITNFVSGAFK